MNSKFTITVVHLQSVIDYPPVISLIRCLLNQGHKVNLVTYDADKLPKSILSNNNFSFSSKPSYGQHWSIKAKIKKLILNKTFGRKCTKTYMQDSDILWTTTDLTVRYLGRMVLKYKHIMQLMELLEYYYPYPLLKFIKFPISRYAQNAWKVVCPEKNRAYIQKAWWNLKETPTVLPNKLYSNEINYIELLSDEDKDKLELFKNEKKKIILYLGVIEKDRDLQNYVKALDKLGDDFCLYILGKLTYRGAEDDLKKLLSLNQNVYYLGYFKAPSHLSFVKYSYIGLLPYKVNKVSRNVSILNALYCAPNKIFEYAQFGVPMVGSDVLGLDYQFSNFDIGLCAKDDSVDSIVDCIRKIDTRYSEMSHNCKIFYEYTNYENIVDQILTDK